MDAASERLAGTAALFAILAPTLASFFGERVVLLIFSAALLATSGFFALKKGKIFFTTQTALLLASGLFTAGMIAFAPDKGGVFYIAMVLVSMAAASLSLASAVDCLGEQTMRLMTAKSVYSGAVLYAVFSIFYQIFISADFMSCRMDFGKGTSFFTSALMLLGILSALRLYNEQKKRVSFIAPLLIMAYVFVFSFNAAGFLIAALTVFVGSLKKGKKRYIALSLVLSLAAAAAVLGEIARNAETIGIYLKAAVLSMFKVIPTGLGGVTELYLANIDKPPLAVALFSQLGLFGTVLTILLFGLALQNYFKNKSSFTFAETAISIFLLFSPYDCAVLLAVILALLAVSEKKERKALQGAAFCAPLFAVGLFMLYMGIARIPAVIGEKLSSHAESESFYATSGALELFEAENWYEAFLAASDEESDSLMAETYLLNAIKFDDKNISYKSALAELYTAEERDAEALAVWNKIMRISNDERLYGAISEKIYNVMEDSTDDPEYERELYEKIVSLASKAKSPEVIKEVNDIAARSQHYYIAGIEGTAPQGDMYAEEPSSENASELPTEESS